MKLKYFKLDDEAKKLREEIEKLKDDTTPESKHILRGKTDELRETYSKIRLESMLYEKLLILDRVDGEFAFTTEEPINKYKFEVYKHINNEFKEYKVDMSNDGKRIKITCNFTKELQDDIGKFNCTEDYFVKDFNDSMKIYWKNKIDEYSL